MDGIEEYLKSINILKVFVYMTIITISLSLHELAHAIMARAMGAYVAQYHIGMIYFLPCVSTVICGLEKITVSSQIKVALAGITANLWLYSLGIWASAIFFDNNLGIYLSLFTFFNFMIALFNLTIFLRTDGLHVLSVIVDCKKLRKLKITNNKNSGKRSLLEIYYLIFYVTMMISLLVCLLID